MSDFLARLAARQLGDVPMVSPRLPLRFAPVVEQPPDEPVLPVPASSPQWPAVEHVVPPPAPVVPPVVVVAPPAPSADAPRAQSIEPAMGRHDEIPPRRAPASVPSPTPIREPRAATPPRPPEPASPPAAAEQAARTTPILPLARIADPPPHDDTPGATVAPAPPLVAPRRHVVPMVDAPPLAEAAPPQVPAGPPTVTVTIGRLEVRAAPTPPIAERKRPAPPTALSLEEYLDRRRAPRR